LIIEGLKTNAIIHVRDYTKPEDSMRPSIMFDCRNPEDNFRSSKILHCRKPKGNLCDCQWL